jgi:hypothetical protein
MSEQDRVKDMDPDFFYHSRFMAERAIFRAGPALARHLIATYG